MNREGCGRPYIPLLCIQGRSLAKFTRMNSLEDFAQIPVWFANDLLLSTLCLHSVLESLLFSVETFA